MFRTKTSSDNKVCKERKHRITLLILGVFRVGIKKHSKDNEKSIVKMEKPVRCDGLHTDRLYQNLVLEKIVGTQAKPV